MDKPSLTNRPSKPVTPKKEPKGITVSVDMDTDKMQLKLRAIAKHTTALADELDAIDNAWQCDCGSTEFVDFYLDSKVIRRECEKCSEQYAMNDDGLPTQLEGSE